MKNLIFDWSGTLSDDLTPVYKATMEVFKKLRLRILTLEEYKKEFILPYMEFYKKFKKDIDKKEIDNLFFEEINKVEEPNPFPKAKKTLEFFNKKNIKMALLSSHPHKKLEKEIKNYGFNKLFIDINGSVHDKTKTIIGIMKRNKFMPDETAYVGDMTHDIEAGKKAGVITIAVSWGYQTKKQLMSAKPDYIVNNFAELKEIKWTKNL